MLDSAGIGFRGVKEIMAFPTLGPWQYRLTPATGAEGRRCAGRELEVGDGLPVVSLQDPDGTEIGILLGFAIDLQDGNLPQGRLVVAAAATPEARAEALLRRLAGRYLVVFDLPGFRRIYPDVSAQLPCLLDRKTGAIGSTADALLDEADYQSRFDHALYEALGVDGEGWFPAGLTAHRDIERLLPDHALDLDTGRMFRFWPRTVPVTPQEPAQVVSQVVTQIRRQIEALLGGPKRVALALTGGHETRMILACARPFLKDVDIVTIVGSDRHTTDTVLARRITKTLGLRHRELSRREATVEQRAVFMRRGGHCNGDSNSRFHPSVWPIAESHVFVGGLGGEVGRAFFWRPSDTPATRITTELLINRFGLPAVPALVAAVERWQAGLPEGANALTTLDLAYHENRNGPWYAAQFCCDPTLVRQAPLMTRDLIEAMMALPPEWKRESRLSHAVTMAAWPELAAFPYNSLGRWHNIVVKLQKAAADPRIILKKIRKMR